MWKGARGAIDGAIDASCRPGQMGAGSQRFTLALSMLHRVMLLGLAVPALVLAQPFDSRTLAHPSTTLGMTLSLSKGQDKQPELPRFRAGANLVRVDAYVSKDDLAISDLSADDFELYEDDKPQRIENLELVRARGPVPATEQRDPTNTRDMRYQADSAARLFTLFFDRLYVSLSGAYYLQKPLIETLGKVIGPDDMVGALTPDMPPSAITYGRRTQGIEQLVTEWWVLGAKGQVHRRDGTGARHRRVLSGQREEIPRHRRRDGRPVARGEDARRTQRAGYAS